VIMVVSVLGFMILAVRVCLLYLDLMFESAVWERAMNFEEEQMSVVN
jgi:hypothetical protein